MNQNGIAGQSIGSFMNRIHFQRGLAFGVIIIAALLAFEVFNYSTTDYALTDLLGELSFVGIRWSTILALAFCGIDFAGIARLFTPEDGADQPGEVWYLFGAWLLAATMNAMLTWWGVSLAVLNHETLGNAVIERTTLLRVVPIFVAVLVWLIRVLIIGTFSVAGDRLFSMAEHGAIEHTRLQPREYPSVPAPAPRSLGGRLPAAKPVAATNAFRPAAKQAARTENNLRNESSYSRPELTYTSDPLSMSAIPPKNKANSERLPGTTALKNNPTRNFTPHPRNGQQNKH